MTYASSIPLHIHQMIYFCGAQMILVTLILYRETSKIKLRKSLKVMAY